MFQQYRINTKGLEDRRGGVFPSAVFLVHQGRAHEDFEKSILEQRSQDAPWVWSSAPKATSNDRWAQWRLTNAINNQFYRMYHKYNTATFKIRR
ncbi:hypothetical protein GNI_158160 [Gregarina niphandrodes]|uniref:Uncharacterized protein n=1 Tax=Gregarina niphandrodes TaxID=110365 RepID=A0A023AYU8_GRENI|nr:hypothetical protein GNI_158160 [Gregarina niphandrodes]EZG43809.1 hypothetical protein GNI_158160 [Gregarina niphandrodes]|eukprot:XP_011133019.1 hypothetical protein GNI_158160 [Gregarina niphandrodes]